MWQLQLLQNECKEDWWTPTRKAYIPDYLDEGMLYKRHI